jgi:hypothetical protein
VTRSAPRAAVVRAIGRDGWAVAERPVDYPTPLVVERVADELRAAVRSDTGWTPAIRVLDELGRDVTSRYAVE